MALVLPTASARWGTHGSLENTVERPNSFNVQQVAFAASFLDADVFYPRGIEDAAAGGAHGVSTRLVRPHAAFPRSTPISETTLGPPTMGLRPQLLAFVAAKGVIHHDTRFAIASVSRRGDDALARGIVEELRSAATNRVGTPGPHGSQPSRRVAATLLLPSAVNGKLQASSESIALLDAFAAIAQSSPKLPVFDATGVPTNRPSIEEALLSTNGTATSCVRFGVVCGIDDVAVFAQSLGVDKTEHFKSSSWKQSAILCFSFVCDGGVEHVVVPITTNLLGFKTPAERLCDAAAVLQQHACTAQLQAGGKLVLPPGFLKMDFLLLSNDDEGEVSQFLEFNADLQRAFKKLHFPDPVRHMDDATVAELVSSSRTDGRSLSNQPQQRFCRVFSRNSPRFWELGNPNHALGVLWTTDQEAFDEYLRRCREGELSPVYGLQPPVDEESRTCLPSVLMWKDDVAAVGKHLNLFFLREPSRMGMPVTDCNNSVVRTVVSELWPIGALLESGFFVIPCTTDSMRPQLSQPRAGVAEEATRRAFLDVINNTFAVIKSAFPPRVGSPRDVLGDEPATALLRAVDPVDGASSDGLFAALAGARVGQAAATIGDAYSILQEHVATDRSDVAAFFKLLTIGVRHHGSQVSMRDLFESAADALEVARATAEAERYGSKRPKTPDLTAELSPPSVSSMGDARQVSLLSIATSDTVDVPMRRQDSLVGHFTSKIQRKRVLSLAGVDPWPFPEIDEIELEWPLDANDAMMLKETAWISLQWLSKQNSAHSYNDWIGKSAEIPSGPVTATAVAAAFSSALASYTQHAKACLSHAKAEDVDIYLLVVPSNQDSPSMFRFESDVLALCETAVFAACESPTKKLLFEICQENASTLLLKAHRG